jgi:HrpA-like RNA helicase
VIALHSTVPFEEQQPVFEPAPPGQCKVILATNIAESSVTISDAIAVIDCGRVKELRYDPQRRMSVLDTVAASRASATQVHACRAATLPPCALLDAALCHIGCSCPPTVCGMVGWPLWSVCLCRW